MKIAMIGAGYVGLVSGACLADFGHDVTVIDNNPERVASLGRGEIPIFEPGLDSLVKANEAAGRLRFTGSLAEGIAGAAAIFIAVGTPSRHGDGHADLSYVHAAARELAPLLAGFTVVIDKSTVPVGTGDEVERIIREANPAADFAVVSNPEFLREGAAIEDFTHPDRIVIGVEDERARAVMAEIYRPLALNQAPVMYTSRRSAELIKYAGNAFLAMKITFINEIADLAEAAGANVQEVARGIGADRRIGGKFLNAGPGYGGSCFPKDTRALMRTAQELGRPLRLIEATTGVNADRHRAMTAKIVQACGGSVAGKRIGVLGLTFKPNTDDMREAPSLAILADLMDQEAQIAAYDPEGMDNARPLLPGVAFGAGPYDIASGADALVLITEWTVFRALDLNRLRQAMRTPVFVDLRNVYRRAEMAAAGFTYRSVGRPNEDVG
ncbi:MAG TPA: UDP-glucose/GDP-mannose dehydrogenase family protein [Devosia sp.]|nr:UDP-glucose/GDP-mannose dehydrogenase family protein [Devosia sp.]